MDGYYGLMREVLVRHLDEQAWGDEAGDAALGVSASLIELLRRFEAAEPAMQDVDSIAEKTASIAFPVERRWMAWVFLAEVALLLQDAALRATNRLRVVSWNCTEGTIDDDRLLAGMRESVAEVERAVAECFTYVLRYSEREAILVRFVFLSGDFFGPLLLYFVFSCPLMA